jgi:hypothetical protein
MTDEQLEHEDEIIGHALDALDAPDDADGNEGAGIEGAGIALNPDDFADVREYQVVLSHMPFEEIAPPTALEARMLDAARAARVPDVPSLVSRRRRTARIVALGAAAAIAAAVTLVVVIDNGQNTRGTSVQFAAQADRGAASRFLTGPHHTIDLKDAAGRVLGRVVLTPAGDGALYDTNFPPRQDGTTYWFWVSGANGALRVGTLQQLSFSMFTVHGPMTGALISAEPSGTQPVHPGIIVAQGRIN